MSSRFQSNCLPNEDRRALQSMVFVSSYAPRQCGIAAFTRDLRGSVAPLLGSDSTPVVAIEDVCGEYNYADEVKFALPQQDRSAYRLVADLLNVEQYDVAVIQHEYGIFGGPDGAYVADLIARLHMPVITTLHTVLANPGTGQRDVLLEIAQHSARLVVMSEKARALLREVYSIADDKISYIPHGIPELPFVDPHFYSEELNTRGRRVMLTFGLLGPGKGIENILRAMPQIIAEHPDVLYIVLGATHPHVRRQAGEQYRDSLVKLTRELGVSDHVRFEDRYVDQDELAKFLGLADLYVIPYPNPAQITSGTLAYAAGAGNAIVSTPFWHAEELLADGRGQLVPFNDVKSTANAIVKLLSDENARHAMRRAAYQHTRSMIWPEVGHAYARLAAEVLTEHRAGGAQIAESTPSFTPAIDDVPTLEHLERLTDDTGLLQHAKFAIPDRDHGYCTDDNARALTAALNYHEAIDDSRALVLADRYLAFLNHAFDRSRRRFRNFLSYDRRWLEEIGSEDSHGRAVWSLGHCVLAAPSDGSRYCAYRLFKDSLPITESFSSPRSWAFALLGIDRYLQRFPFDSQVQRMMLRLTDRLNRFASNFIDLSTEARGWPWPEPELTYDNARIPQAMIVIGTRLNHHSMLETGTRMLQWLAELQTNHDGAASLVGNSGWATCEGARAIFDQQPLEAAAFVEAAADAYRATGDERWFDTAKRFYLWFHGHNDLALPLRDPVTHGCGDGLHAGGVNMNQGAESTLALLASALIIRNLYRDAVSDSTVATVA